MAIELVGYARLINKYNLACILPTCTAMIDTSVKGRVKSDDTLRFEPKYRPSDNVSEDLQDRKSTRLNSSHLRLSRMPSSA